MSVMSDLGDVEGELKGKPWNKDVDKYFSGVFGRRTLLTVYYLINKGLISKIGGELSRGKEAAVFSARTSDGRIVAVKIYRPYTSFKLERLLRSDPRFGYVKKSGVISAWARKEFKNLALFQEAGVRVPKPIFVRENVLLMEFIGVNSLPAPTYHDAPPENPEEAYAQVIAYMKKAYSAGIVHGDLSEYNILNMGEPVFIECAQ